MDIYAVFSLYAILAPLGGVKHRLPGSCDMTQDNAKRSRSHDRHHYVSIATKEATAEQI
jgi:hypothetical protein